MHHVLAKTAAARVGRVGTHREIIVPEHAPGTDHFDALRRIGVDQKVVSHSGPLELEVAPRRPVMMISCSRPIGFTATRSALRVPTGLGANDFSVLIPVRGLDFSCEPLHSNCAGTLQPNDS